jgi:hypothetical protein
MPLGRTFSDVFAANHAAPLKVMVTKVSEVAVKRAIPDAPPEAQTAFLEEAMIMTQFQHRNILRLIGCCTSGTVIAFWLCDLFCSLEDV